MPNTTLLDVVQTILSDMNSDEVNSIGDTIEATQIATVVKEVYTNIIDELDLQHVYKLNKLIGLGDVDRPCIMSVPSELHSIKWIKYNIKKGSEPDNYRTCVFYEPDRFVEYVNSFNRDDPNVETEVIQNGISLPYRTDQAPYIWTTFDGTEVVFDSIDLNEESSLTDDRSIVYSQSKPNLIIDNATVIDLPHRFISLLKNEARLMAFDLYKGGVPMTVAQAASRSRVRAQRTRHVDRMNREQINRPDYGRKRR